MKPNKRRAYPLTFALLAMATSYSLALTATVPAPTDFWIRDKPGRITHACTGTEPLVMCLQGRKVVMQVQFDRTNGFSYTARFFNLLTDVEKKKVLLAKSTRPTEWGRETYYALRVLFKAGRTEDGLDLTRRIVQAQIFGSKGPYPDEDAIDMLCPGSLYPRVFTEGMFGIVPTGLDSFECTPWLPKSWSRMALRDLRAFGRAWDLVVERAGDQQKVSVRSSGKTVMTGLGPAGKTYSLTFPKGRK